MGWLTEAVKRGHVLLDLTLHPTFEPLSEHPEYLELLKKMKTSAANCGTTLKAQIAAQEEGSIEL